MPEGVVGVGLAAGQAATGQQHRLVARVGHRMQGLGQHRGRPGDQVADELGHGDAQVGQQGDDDGLGAMAISLSLRLQLLWQPTFLSSLGHAPTPTGPAHPGPADQKRRMLVAVIIRVMPIIPLPGRGRADIPFDDFHAMLAEVVQRPVLVVGEQPPLVGPLLGGGIDERGGNRLPWRCPASAFLPGGRPQFP